VRRVVFVGGVVLLAGCGGEQSTLAPESDASRSVETMWWVLLIISTIVVGVVTLLVLAALLKRRGRLDHVAGAGGGRTFVLVSGALVPIVVLIALFVYVLSSLDATAQPKGRAELNIEVVGKQWWWAVRYPEQRITTANEIHIPVGVPVRVLARTDDVIHSFWVPRLNRKIDMIPGRRNAILLEADRPGRYRGQCAEYCGLQHANMAFYVIAEPRGEWERWAARERQAARAAGTGARVFSAAGCSGCHTIRGTSANGKVGPDLTHVANRMTLAAGTIPNEKAWLGGWIVDPQHFKPGNKMPGLPLRGRQLRDLVDYLESLR
jgi:cytochrome c oxidase subunit 2